MKIKFIKIGGVLILILSLVFALSISKTDRRQAINKAIKSKKLDVLPDSTKAILFALLHKLSTQAGVTEPISLNKEFTDGRELRFFCCSSQMISITNCSKGNGIYDSELNAIFIDQSLVAPNEWNLYIPDVKFGVGPDDMPFLKTYLEFIILHELGHYKMHKISSGFFDANTLTSNRQSRRFEVEADSFAVKNLTDIIATDSKFLSAQIGSNIGLDIDSNSTPSNKAVTAIAEIGYDMFGALMLGPSNISPYQEDLAHPTFIDRSISAIQAILKAAPENNKFYAKAKWIELCLKKEKEILSNNSIIEVALSKQILNVNFDNTGILLQPLDTFQSMCFVDYNSLKTNIGEPFKKVKVTTIESLQPIAIDEFQVDGLYTFKQGKTIAITHDGRVVSQKKNSWLHESQKLDSLLYRVPKATPIQRQPVDSLIYLSDYSRSYQLKYDNSITVMVHDSIEHQIKIKLQKQNIDVLWDETVIGDKNAYVMVSEVMDSIHSLYGMAVINLSKLTLNNILELNLKDAELEEICYKFDEQKTRILISDEETEKYYLLTSQLRGSKNGQYAIWEVSAEQPPNYIISEDFIFKNIPGKETLGLSPRLFSNSVLKISATEYVVNWNDDLVYLINVKNGTIKPIFFPGSDTMRLRGSSKGDVAIYCCGLYKLYIIQPKKYGSKFPLTIIITMVIVSLIIGLGFINLISKRKWATKSQ